MQEKVTYLHAKCHLLRYTIYLNTLSHLLILIHTLSHTHSFILSYRLTLRSMDRLAKAVLEPAKDNNDVADRTSVKVSDHTHTHTPHRHTPRTACTLHK